MCMYYFFLDKIFTILISKIPFSVITILLGMRLPATTDDVMPDVVIFVFVCYIIFHVLMSIILEINKYYINRKSKGKVSVAFHA